VVIGITTLAFALIHLVPGDPARIELGPTATPAALAHLRDELGLNHPLVEQYWHFMRGAFTGSFGNSLQYQQSVSSIIGPRITASALLIGYSLLIAILVALPLAVLAMSLGLEVLRVELGMTAATALSVAVIAGTRRLHPAQRKV